MATDKLPGEPAEKRSSGLRVAFAAILDFITVFLIFGFAVAWLFGGLTDGGFALEGWRALLVFALMAAYFVVFTRYLGGTLWRRILRVRR